MDDSEYIHYLVIAMYDLYRIKEAEEIFEQSDEYFVQVAEGIAEHHRLSVILAIRKALRVSINLAGVLPGWRVNTSQEELVYYIEKVLRALEKI